MTCVGSNEVEALAMALALEARSHEQMYWVERDES
jgi:hypothetical protein